MGVHDLNFGLPVCDPLGFEQPGVMHERGQDAVRAGHGVRAVEDVRARRRATQGRCRCAHAGLRRPVSCLRPHLPLSRRNSTSMPGHQRHLGQTATELRVMQDLPAEKVPQLIALVDEIGTLSAHPDINLHGLAKDLNFADLYTLVYRTFSQDAHPSATSLEHHVELTDTGKITGFRVGPDYVQLADRPSGQRPTR